jgi:Zn2+/Cd2+-exporting ATPase
VLAVAVACERLSEHPLARAIVAAGSPAGSPGPATCGCDDCDDDCHDDNPREDHIEALTATRFHAIAGRGVRADIDGRTYLVGKPGLFPAADGDTELATALRDLESQGKSVVVVGTPENVMGVVAIADTPRPQARAALSALRAQGVEHIAMLTGDNRATAHAIGTAAGVDEVRAALLPEDKVEAVRELRERYGHVVMVGDGVNDAPALASADIGIAMGAAGTDAALETADIALMGDDLMAVADAVALSRRTTRVVYENIVLAIAIKAVFLVLAPLGLITLWLAVFADMGTSLLVIANGMRLRLDGSVRPADGTGSAEPDDRRTE